MPANRKPAVKNPVYNRTILRNHCRMKYLFAQYFDPDLIGRFLHPSEFVLIEIDQDYVAPMHIHSTCYELMTILEGEYECILNNSRLKLCAGDVLLVQAGDRHMDDSHHPGLVLSLGFYVSDWLGAEYNGPILSNGRTIQDRIRHIPRGSRTEMFIQTARDGYGEAGSFGRQAALAFAELLIWSLFDLYENNISEVFRSDVDSNQFMLKVRNLFNEHIRDNLSVTEMAEAVSMGRRAFEDKCIRILGRTPAKAFLAVKLTRAAELLRSGRSSKDVAAILGFNNQFHFSRAFKAYFKVNASQMLQTHLEG